MRKCVICGQEKEDCAFIHDKYAKDGIRNVCLECNKKRAQKRRNNYKQHLENLENKLKEYETTILKENKRLKENIHSMLFTDDVIQKRYDKVSKENKKLKELLKEYKKQLSEIKNAYIDLTTQDEYGSYYIDEAKLFVEIVGKIIKDFKTENE